MKQVVAHWPLWSIDRARSSLRVGVNRRGWSVEWCGRPRLRVLHGRRRLRPLKCCHRITQIGNPFLQIGPPCNELVDLGRWELYLNDYLDWAFMLVSRQSMNT